MAAYISEAVAVLVGYRQADLDPRTAGAQDPVVVARIDQGDSDHPRAAVRIRNVIRVRCNQTRPSHDGT